MVLAALVLIIATSFARIQVYVMTAFFISHGAPTLAIEPGETGKLLAELGASLPRPSAILVASAHWDTQLPTISTCKKPETIHDFGGFSKQMYEIQYPANGAPAMAVKAADLLIHAGINVRLDVARGLDHGAWVPLMLMYPQANILVAQISIQSEQSPQAHFELGQALSDLQADNVMLIASGSATHNLHDFFSPQRDAKTLDYVPQFANWLAERIEKSDHAALFDYRNQNQFAVRAHPTEDHILPLFVALGWANGSRNKQAVNKPVKRYTPENTYGILAMDIYHWH